MSFTQNVCRSMTATVFSVLGLAALTTAAFAQSVLLSPAAEKAAHSQISRATLEAPIRFLADDLLEGRGPATRGDELARLYLARELQGFGLPAGRRERRLGAALRRRRRRHEGARGRGASPARPATSTSSGTRTTSRASGVQAPAAGFENAELVFVGYGIEAPEYQWDDFKGADVKGKVLVMLNNDPDWDPKLFAGKTRLYYGRWVYKYESAARHGAAGVIIVHTTPSAGYPWQVVQSSWGGEQFELPAEGEPRIQLKGWATEEAARRLAKAGGQRPRQAHRRGEEPASFKPVPLGSRRRSSSTTRSRSVQTANVAGLLPGSDPKLKDEVVVIYRAPRPPRHRRRPTPPATEIYNGAEDNASGCAQVLAIARAFAALPQRPRRSVLVLFVAAEEQGLLGSQVLRAAPHVRAGQDRRQHQLSTAAISAAARKTSRSSATASPRSMSSRRRCWSSRAARWCPTSFRIAASTTAPTSSTSPRSACRRCTSTRARTTSASRAGWGKQQQEEWEEKTYHQPSDEIDDTWVFDGMIEDAQIGFYAAWLVAQADAMPTWNPGDEFEATRLRALQQVSAH